MIKVGYSCVDGQQIDLQVTASSGFGAILGRDAFLQIVENLHDEELHLLNVGHHPRIRHHRESDVLVVAVDRDAVALASLMQITFHW